MTSLKKYTLSEITDLFLEHNRKNGYEYGIGKQNELSAIVVFKQSNFNKEYSELSRSYRITSNSGKRFYDGLIGNSIFANCLDGSEQGVRLDWYNWEVEYCYLEESVKSED